MGHLKIEGYTGGSIEDSELIAGMLFKRDMSHIAMDKVVENAKIAMISNQLRLPQPKCEIKYDIETK